MHYNMCLIKKVHYSEGIFTTNKRQETVLKNTCESFILNKIGLSEKFPRKVLHERKSALEVGLIAPIAIMNVLALKLHVSHNRGETRVLKIIKINENNTKLHYGFAAGTVESHLE